MMTAVVRIRMKGLVNLFGTLICDELLSRGRDGVLWLAAGDFE